MAALKSSISSDETDSIDRSIESGEEMQPSSWTEIYNSIKNHIKTGECVGTDTIFEFANRALIHGHPVISVKLFALALQQQYQHSCQKKLDTDINISNFDIRKLSLALSHCETTASQLNELSCKPISMRTRNGLLKAVNKIVKYCDFLTLVDAHLLSNTGALYFRLDDYQRALHLTARAVNLDPTNLSAQETYENLCCHLVERWHFIMLNDKIRNYAYQRAIQSAIESLRQKVIICDIGCGTGLLSLIACQQSKSCLVYAIEKSIVMCDIADSVFKANLNLDEANKIQIINQLSTQISVPKDMTYKADILVTETFDAGLFGEGILPTLCHAWSNLISNNTTKKGQIIPSKACLYMQLVESNYVQLENRYIGTMEGLDISKLHIFSSVGMCESEPYAALDLKCLPGGFRTLSEPVCCIDVDFNNPEQLTRLNEGFIQRMSTRIVSSGRLDAIVVWFSLYLNESVVISTHTDCNSCWDQAIFPIYPFRVMDQPQGTVVDLHVAEGDIVYTEQRIRRDILCMTVSSITTKIEKLPQNDRSTCVVQECTKPLLLSDPLEWCKHHVYCLKSWEIYALNDTLLQSVKYQRVKELFTHMKEDYNQIHLIHINNGFSPLCLQAIQLGFQETFCIVDNKSQEALLLQIAAESNIDLHKFTFVDEASDIFSVVHQKNNSSHKLSGIIENAQSSEAHLSQIPKSCSEEFGSALIEESCKPPLHHEIKSEHNSSVPLCQKGIDISDKTKAVAVFDVVDHQGRLIESLSSHLNVLQLCLSEYPEFVITPSSLDVYGMLIDSEQLLRLSYVQSDDNTLGFNIGSFMNKFGVRNYQGILLHTLPHVKLSMPFKMFTINFNELVGLARSEGQIFKCLSELNKQKNTLQKSSRNTNCSAANQGYLANTPAAEFPTDILNKTSSELTSVSSSGNNCRSSLQCKVNSLSSDLQEMEAGDSERWSYETSPYEALLADENTDIIMCQQLGGTMLNTHKLKPFLKYHSGDRTFQNRESFSERANLQVNLLSTSSYVEQNPTICASLSNSKVKNSEGKVTEAEMQSCQFAEMQKEHIDDIPKRLSFHHEDCKSENEATGTDVRNDGLNQAVHLKVPITQSGTVTALIYWFELHVSPTCSISTVHPEHHWQQAAVMTSPSQRRHWKQGEVLSLCCKIYDSVINFFINGKT